MGMPVFGSRVCFCIYSENGDDCGSFANALRCSEISFKGLIVRNGMLYGYINRHDITRLTSLAEQKGLFVKIISRSGFYYVSKGYHKRYGIVIGIVLAVCFIAFMQNRVTVIEVGGCEQLSEEHIISLLNDVGIYVGADISEIDLRDAEKKILAMDKDIAWIGIRNTGSRVVTEIQEIDPVPEMERKNTPCNIIASRDAQIKNVRVYSGMLIPMVGEGVKKGDVLISGVVDTKFGRAYYVHSIGEITGIYKEKMTFSQPFNDTEKICIGEVTKKAVCIFGKKIVYSSSGKVSGEYECTESEDSLMLGKVTFPIKFIRLDYRLLADNDVVRTEAEADEMLFDRMKKYENNLLSDSTIVDREIVRTVSDKGVTLSVEYTLEGEIGMEKEFFAKYEPDGVNRKKDEK